MNANIQYSAIAEKAIAPISSSQPILCVDFTGTQMVWEEKTDSWALLEKYQGNKEKLLYLPQDWYINRQIADCNIPYGDEELVKRYFMKQGPNNSKPQRIKQIIDRREYAN